MPYAPTPDLLIESHGPVTVLTLNNPDTRNAFTDDLHEAMAHVWDDLAADHSIRAVVLTGAGKAFSAGGDVPGFIRNYEDQDYRRLSLRRARRIMDAMAEFPKPVVAAVNGPAVGLGASTFAASRAALAAAAMRSCRVPIVDLLCGLRGLRLKPRGGVRGRVGE